MPIDDGKRNPLSSTYLEILLEGGSAEAAAKKDEQSKTAYRQYFDTRHRVRPLSSLLPGDSVHVKLYQQKGWKTPGKVIGRSPTPRSYLIQTPTHSQQSNGLEMSDEHDLGLEPTSKRCKLWVLAF